MHMSARFIKIPIVFRQPVSQRGLIYSDSTPNYFTHTLRHTRDLMRLLLQPTWCLCIALYAVDGHILYYTIPISPRHSVQTRTINRRDNMTPQEARYRPVV